MQRYSVEWWLYSQKMKNLTKPAEPSVSYAFAVILDIFESIIPIIKNVDVLYHEATFYMI